MIGIALELEPEIVTLVPEKRQERTTEGGLDPAAPGLERAIGRLREGKIEVSLFIDPDPEVVLAAARLGADIVELHTGDYCEAGRGHAERELRRLQEAAAAAQAAGVRVAAGHGLDYPNVRPVAQIAQIEELNIGHAIISRAVFSGLEGAVRDMLALINAG